MKINELVDNELKAMQQKIDSMEAEILADRDEINTLTRMIDEMKNERSALVAEIARLREALQPFAQEFLTPDEDDFHRARATLVEKERKPKAGDKVVKTEPNKVHLGDGAPVFGPTRKDEK